MLNAFIKKITNGLYYLLGASILLGALSVGALRLVTPTLDKHRPEIEALASKLIAEPVSIKKVHTYWSHLTPMLRLSQVTVHNRQKTKKLLRIQEISLGVNLWESLIHFRVVPSVARLRGVDLVVKQAADGSVRFQGLQTMLSRKEKAESLDNQRVLAWLLTRHYLAIDNINLLWYDRSGVVYPFKGIQVSLRNGLRNHHIVGRATLNQEVASHLKFIADFTGLTPEAIHGKVYLSAEGFNLRQWLRKRRVRNVEVEKGLMNLKLWLHWNDAHISSVQGLVGLTALNLLNHHTLAESDFKKVFAHFSWRALEDNRWQVEVSPLQVKTEKQTWPQVKLLIKADGTPDARSWVVQSSAVDFGDLWHLNVLKGLLPWEMTQAIEHLGVKGIGRNVLLNFTDWEHWQIAGLATDVSWKAWHQIPGGKQLQVGFNIGPSVGEVNITGQTTQVNFGQLFLQPFTLEHLDGIVHWWHTDKGWFVQSPYFEVADNQLGLVGQGAMHWPGADAPLALGLLVRAKGKSLHAIEKYLPQAPILSKQLIAWLTRGIKSVHQLDSTFVLRGLGRDFPYADATGRFLIDSDFTGLNLDFEPGWPLVSGLAGNLVFDALSMDASVLQGHTVGATLKNGHVRIPNLGAAVPLLQVSTAIDGDLTQGATYVKKSPLKQWIGPALAPLEPSGPLQLQLDLGIPLAKDKPVTVAGDLRFKQAIVSLPDWDLHLHQVTGAIDFTENSIQAKAINAKLFKEPVAFTLSTSIDKQIRTIHLDGAGQLTAQAIYSYFGFPILKTFSGRSPFTIAMAFPFEDRPNTIRIASSLQGVAIDLPQPLGKAADLTRPLQVTVSFGPALETVVRSAYDKALTSAFAFSSKKGKSTLFERGHLVFGNEPAEVPSELGLLVTGKLDHFDWATWQPYMQTNPLGHKQGSFVVSPGSWANTVRLVDINVTKLQAFAHQVNHVRLQLTRQAKAWLVSFSSEKLVGSVTVPDSKNGKFESPILVKLSKFYLDEVKVNQNKSWSLHAIPTLYMHCSDCRYKGVNLGELELNLAPLPKQAGIRIEKLAAHSDDLQLDAAGQWRRQAGKEDTSLFGKIESTDLMRVLKYWGLDTDIVGSKGQVDFNLAWPDTPFKPALKTLSGEFAIHLGPGRIVDIGAKANAEMGAGKILTLFNLRTLPRRLRLDFRDLTNKGFSFDEMKGHFVLAGGNARTKDTEFNGPVAKAEIAGSIGLITKDLDLKLRVTPYVTSSLPVLAAVVVNPLVGAAAWLADTVVGGQLAKLTTYSYRVTGAWDNLKVDQVKKIQTARPVGPIN